MALVEGLLQKEPDNVLAHYNLGNWLIRLGRHGEAARHYLRVLEINPSETKAHLNLGLLYLQYLNRPQDALTHLEKCLEIDPHQPQAKRIKDTIDYLKAGKAESLP